MAKASRKGEKLYQEIDPAKLSELAEGFQQLIDTMTGYATDLKTYKWPSFSAPMGNLNNARDLIDSWIDTHVLPEVVKAAKASGKRVQVKSLP